MLKPFLTILVAGTVGFVSILAGYWALVLHDGWLPAGVSNTALIAELWIPIPIGLSIAWAVYRGLDRITGTGSKHPR
jgi:hypothetical protein